MPPFGSTTRPILVVEPHARASEWVQAVLRRSGYTTVAAADGRAAMQQFRSQPLSLVLLELQLPVLDGWSVLNGVRRLDGDVPIVMLTATADETAKVRALRWGADDYIVKPVGTSELLARVIAVLRRTAYTVEQPSAAPVYEDQVVRLDHERRQVWIEGRRLGLSPLEFRLMACFVENGGRTLGKDELLQRVWGDTSTRTPDHLKIYVGYLRRKLRELTDLELITTVRGHGYRWSSDPVHASEALGLARAAA